MIASKSQPHLLLLLILIMSNQLMAKPISIRTLSDLEFGTLIQGDSPKVIPADTTETAANASFAVAGDRDISFTITLPSSSSLQHEALPDTLTLSSFTSYPSVSGVIDSKGKAELYVGATLSSIPSNAAPGAYTGNFIVDVIYN